MSRAVSGRRLRSRGNSTRSGQSPARGDARIVADAGNSREKRLIPPGRQSSERGAAISPTSWRALPRGTPGVGLATEAVGRGGRARRAPRSGVARSRRQRFGPTAWRRSIPGAGPGERRRDRSARATRTPSSDGMRRHQPGTGDRALLGSHRSARKHDTAPTGVTDQQRPAS